MRRLVVVLDSSGPLDAVDAEIHSWRAWAASDRRGGIDLGVVLAGERAGWSPGSGALKGSTAARSVGVAARPALREALDRATAGGEIHAMLVALAREPAPDWDAALAQAPRIRACVALSREPVAALGQGHLGPPFRAGAVGVALRWLTCEVLDRTWLCACQAVRADTQPHDAPCPSCGAPTVLPPRIRIGGRVVHLTPGAVLYPHHFGRPFAFDEPVAELDAVPRVDGDVIVAGVRAEVRTGPPPPRRTSPSRFRPSPLVAPPDRCAACGGALVAPIFHRAPDPRHFCAPCTAAEPRCDFCEVPLGPSPANVWPDGRTTCRDCWDTAVTDASALRTLEEAARAFLRRRMQMTLPDCPVSLEHAASFARMQGRTFVPQPGFTPRVLGFFAATVATGATAVFVEHGTPRSIAYGVLAHELTHLWQWHNWPRERPRVLVEGLAMWVEYHALLDAGAIHAARHAELYGDPVYGLGFRIALAAEADVGFDAVEARLRTAVVS